MRSLPELITKPSPSHLFEWFRLHEWVEDDLNIFIWHVGRSSAVYAAVCYKINTILKLSASFTVKSLKNSKAFMITTKQIRSLCGHTFIFAWHDGNEILTIGEPACVNLSILPFKFLSCVIVNIWAWLYINIRYLITCSLFVRKLLLKYVYPLWINNSQLKTFLFLPIL